MSFPGLMQISSFASAVLEFVLDQGDGQENSVTLEERYYAQTLRFAVKTLKLRPGFCLHSLPGANGFYRSLKMVNVPEHNKEPLLYFEQ